MLDEVSDKLKKHDPVFRQWIVNDLTKGKIWCDASSLAIGVCLEMDNQVVEDASRLRGNNDSAHINLAELDGVVKGINLAIKWKLLNATVMTDSATVCGWVKPVLTDSKRPKVSGLSEIVVKRRLNLIGELVAEYGLKLSIVLVKSEENKADEMTRVPHIWLDRRVCSVSALVFDSDFVVKLCDLHDTHHLLIERTLHKATVRWGSKITREDVENVCKRIDPAPVRWESGHLDAADDWHRLAMDITHHNGIPYLTVIDCGPSRYAIWRKLKNETLSAVSEQLEHIFTKRGSSAELLSDNGPCFRALPQMLRNWNVMQLFSCAYRPSGNGIIEWNHRTIKWMLARSGGSVNEMLYWYNNSPHSDGAVPFERLHKYKPQYLEASGTIKNNTSLNPYKIGDHVFVKPDNAKCSSVWKPGIITALVSNTAVKVDNMSRHIGNVRFSWHPDCIDQVQPVFLHV
ncbi:uncharacterized protein [Watersipora subatra]|uniref:uncharacterized protein n=1 Tax=Watersipora subatra TaxID=2589382 RepID=UPI00355C0E19